MSHQSVANLLIYILEEGDDRSNLQHYFIVRCQLLEQLILRFLDKNLSDNYNSNDNSSSSKYYNLIWPRNDTTMIKLLQILKIAIRKGR